MSEFNKEVFLQNLKEVNTVLKQIHICIDNIVKLSNDMAGADSEINEAILQLQQNVITINGTLNGHTQDITNINTALANKMYKVIEIDDTAVSGTFTTEEYNQILNDNSIVIKRGGGYFIRDFEETSQTNMIRFRHFNTLSVSSNIITASSQYITVSLNNNAWGYTANNDIKFYNKDYIDTYIQYKLSSGVNIKTLNGESILGSGNINVGDSETKYLHRIQIFTPETMCATFYVINNSSTEITALNTLGTAVGSKARASLSGGCYRDDNILQIGAYLLFNSTTELWCQVFDTTLNAITRKYSITAFPNTWTIKDNVSPF